MEVGDFLFSNNAGDTFEAELGELLAEAGSTELSMGALIDLGVNEGYFSDFTSAQRNYFINTVIEHELAANASDLSPDSVNEGEAYPGADVIFVNGYDQLTDELAKGQDIRLNTSR